MGLIKDKTRYFFILPAANEAEERHIYDIAFGLRCLFSIGIAYDDIVVIIDNASDSKINTVFSAMNINIPANIYSTLQLDKILENNNYINAVVFITGHGSPSGLDSKNPIKPYILYKKFQITENFKRVVFYFGQCYAGIFNHMPLSTHLGLENNKKCSITAIGSTGLFSSISSSLKVEDVTWSANIFLAYIFSWITNPIDIDGDGKLSVMNSFKYAAINTNLALSEIKKKDNFQSIVEQSMLIKCLKKMQDEKIPDEDKNNLFLERQSLEKILEIRYIIQTL